MTKIRGQLKSIWPDRTQYKPYAYNLEMENVWVEIDIPKEDVTVTDHIEGGESTLQTTLTLNGFTCLLGNIADAIDMLHLMSLKQKNQSYK